MIAPVCAATLDDNGAGPMELLSPTAAASCSCVMVPTCAGRSHQSPATSRRRPATRRATDDDATSRLIAAVQSDGTCWCGPTVWDGRVALRVSVSGWSTTGEDAARRIEAIVRALTRPAHEGR